MNNLLFLAGIEAALKADPLWQDECLAARPVRGLKAFARVYAGWVVNPAFFRDELYKNIGFLTLEEYLVGAAESYWLQRNPNSQKHVLGSGFGTLLDEAQMAPCFHSS